MGAEYFSHEGSLENFKPVSSNEKKLEEMVLKFNDQDWLMAPKAMIEAMEEIIEFLNKAEMPEEIDNFLLISGTVDHAYGGFHCVAHSNGRWQLIN